jgi:hypothetical protein
MSMNALIMVGTGGVAYHSLSTLVHHIHEQDIGKVIVYDPDQLEPRNRDRQPWPYDAHTTNNDKAELAANLLFYMLSPGPATVEAKTYAVTKPEDIQMDVLSIDIYAGDEDLEAVTVLALPDNNETRAACAKGVQGASQNMRNTAFYFVTAGNTLTSGQAWGYRCLDGNWEDRRWINRHIDMWKPDKPEDDRPKCDREPTQSLIGNLFTASMLAAVLKDLRGGAGASEWYWNTMGRIDSLRMWKEQ